MVFWVTVAISAVFLAFGVFLTDSFSSVLTTFAGGIISGMGWIYMLVTTFFLGFALYLAFGRYGKIRLGGPDEKPEFGLFAWFAMLFQAGMGIGLMSPGSSLRKLK
ncbi:MAG: BCCT family transporter [Rubrobacter sp.]|nr:BCCT family transporter [Rubrobacter sp.]